MNHSTVRSLRFLLRHLLPALLLACALFCVALPSALAAPALQGDMPLVFQSEELPSASGAGRTFTLTLNTDGSATLSTAFGSGEPPVVEIGTWTADEVEQTINLTLTGRADQQYETPTEIVFALGDDASIEAVEYDEALFGSEGLTLALVDEAAAPAQATPVPVATEAPEPESSPVALPTPTRVPESTLTPAPTSTPAAEEAEEAEEAEGTEEAEAGPTTPAGVYVAGPLPAVDETGSTRTLTLTLQEDGAAALVTALLEEPPVEEVGSWSFDEPTEALTVTLSGTADTDYEAPVEIVFAVQEDGTLEAVDFDEALFGSEGLTFEPAGDVPESAAGVYVSDILPAADTPGQVVLMILYPEGAVQASTYYLNGEPPIQELGLWSDGEAGSVTVVVTGSTESAYEVPQELVFERDGDSLTYLSLRLERLPEARAVQRPTPAAWFQSELLPAASSPGRQMNLILFEDGSVQWLTDFLNDEPQIVELGDWVENDDGSLTVTLSGRPDREYEEPQVVTFELDDDGTLTATEYDVEVYGNDGLTFTEQPLDELELDEPLTGGTQGSELEAGPAITITETLTEADDITTTEQATAVEELTEAAEIEVPPYEMPVGAVAVYSSEVLPSASSPGRVLRLVPFEDGSVQMVTDYLNGEAPVLELGTWEDNGDGTLTVELVGQIDGAYATPVLWTFTVGDDVLTAVEWDEALYGSEALELRLESGAAG